MNTTIYYSHFIGLCGGHTIVILTLHAGVCSHMICIMTQTPCCCRQPRVHDSEWATRQPPISPLHPKGLREGQVVILSCPTHLWPNTVSCVPREEKTIQDINIASFRCSSSQGNGSSKSVTWIYKLCFIFLTILYITFWVLLICLKTTAHWKLPLFSASVEEVVYDQAYLVDQQSRNWYF